MVITKTRLSWEVKSLLPGLRPGKSVAFFKQKRRELERTLLMAAAVGDALGLPVEGWTAEKITQTHGRVLTLLPVREVKYFPGEHAAGTTSDETALNLAVFLALRSGLNMPAMAREHIDAYDKAPKRPGDQHPLGWGWSIGDAVQRLKTDADWRTAGKSDKPDYGYGNGVITKLGPLALHLYFMRADLLSRQAVQFIVNLTLMTHARQMAVSASLAYTAALLYCLSRSPETFDRAEFIATIIFYGQLGESFYPADPIPDRLSTRLSRLNDWDKYSDARIISEFGGDGRPSYLYNSLPMALMTFLRDPFSLVSLFDVVNLGEDADSNGVLAAVLLACLHKQPTMFEPFFELIRNKDQILSALIPPHD